MENITDYLQCKGTRFEEKLGVEIEVEKWKSLSMNIMDSTLKIINLTDDWVQAVKRGSGWTKYGRYMYSPKLDKLRSQTLLEFYGDGVVD